MYAVCRPLCCLARVQAPDVAARAPVTVTRFNEAGAFDPTAGAAGTVYAYLGGGAGSAAGGGGGRGSLFTMDVATGALAPARPFEGGFDTIVSDFAVDKRTGRAYAVLQVGSRARPSV